MSSTAPADVLPALPPIRTTAVSPPPTAAESERSSPAAASSSTAPDAESRPSENKRGEDEEVEAEPTTPTSEESRLQPPTECPPAPRKPAWVAPSPPTAPVIKRKFPSTTSAAPPPPRRAFFPVARDLSTVFRALPPKKRIRAG
ncbi:hypothetical protein PR202_ga21539 [Eleusine coracana subsp. coracana]|uniref:Uncharacterized protein n=1 Tax=Eleusine coracana subsp. coracana TaxID=191504 RepID=A0AAV5D099_ELECO|nr:hypothetical protein PR202_ga21539 [Eleusine coracana subsp. coracana]